MMNESTLPIGVFDSGMGGLTAVREIQNILPNEDIIYFGDTSRVPYGTRSVETIIKYASQDAKFLSTFNVKAMVIACGTVSSLALSNLKAQYSFPIIGVVDAAAKAATKATKNNKIAVIGTPATINSNSYRTAIEALGNFDVFSESCPLFVPLVENGFYEGEVARLVAHEYLSPLAYKNPDTVILGCTHYPLMKKVISCEFENAILINTGFEVAHALKNLLMENNIDSCKKEGTISIYVSDKIDNFKPLACRFLGKAAKGVIFKDNKIEIDNY